MDLPQTNQIQLMNELQLAQEVLWNEFHPTQINVAAIGNKIPQLHVHVIARYSHDPAWPGTVWNHPIRSCYSPEQKTQIIQLLKNKLQERMVNHELYKESCPLN